MDVPEQDVPEHLFRHEAGRLVAIVTRLFGIHNLALAEDVVQDAFCRALETWKFHGVPGNPSAWLMQTAKNRALDLLRRRAPRAASRPGRTAARLRGHCSSGGGGVRRGLNDAQLRDVLPHPPAIAGGNAVALVPPLVRFRHR
jgi:predicted RNA polymerase sigma factor